MLEFLAGVIVVVLIIIAWLLYRDVEKEAPVEVPPPTKVEVESPTTYVVVEDEPLPWWYYSGTPAYGGWSRPYGGWGRPYGGWGRPHGGIPHGGWRPHGGIPHGAPHGRPHGGTHGGPHGGGRHH